MLNMKMNESMMKAMMNFGNEISKETIKMCALKYGFDAEDAMRELGDVRMSENVKVKKEKNAKRSEKALFALPFSGECDMSKCHALRQNSGLYTQCQSLQTKDVFCNNCYKLAEKSEDGIPEYGTIQKRIECYKTDVEYVDPKGRKPVAYTKVMKKYKLTQEQVLEEAKKLGIEINPIHFEVPNDTKRGRPASKPKEPKEPKGPKGRPKKEKTVMIASDDSDLFASLVAASLEDENDEQSMTSIEEPEKEDKKAEKEAKKAEKEAAKEAKALEKAEKEAKIAADKAEKEAKIASEKAEKEAKIAAEKAEKEAKIAAEKAEKEAKKAEKEAAKEAKALEKAEKEAAKEAKALEKADKEAKKAEKEAKKAEKEAKKAEKEAKKETKKVEKDEEPEVVKKITYEGKTYLKSKNSGIIYDYDKYVNEDQQVVVGKWNETTQKVDFNKDEESADEYESDDE